MPILCCPAANRDEEVFAVPDEFRIDRADAKHLAFGFGARACLGEHFSRMEISARFRELLRRVQRLALAGGLKYIQSTFAGGLKLLPIRYWVK